MKHILLMGTFLIGSLMTANAQWGWFRPSPQPPRHDYHDHGYDRRHRPMSLEARAQLKLRQYGYYRGPVDGSFGRGSRYALMQFQRDHRLPRTGALDWRTLRALGLR